MINKKGGQSSVISLSNIKKLQSEKGFTIVELLIVVVVIGILAAIVIVAYNGVQNRAKLSSAQAAATSLVKKAEAYNSVIGSYPQTLANFDSQPESKLTSSGIGVLPNATDPTGTNGQNTVQYRVCTAVSTGVGVGGAQVRFWDYAASPAAISTTASSEYMGILNAGNVANCTAWAGFTLVAGN